MKPVHFIPPALAIVGSAYWLLSQNNTISELSEKTRIIKERIVVVEKAAASTPVVVLGAKDPDEANEFTLADGSPDWKTIALMMAELQGSNEIGMPTNIKAMLKLQKMMMELTESELTDGLAAISALGLDPKTTSQLRQGLLQRLGETNPHAALENLGDPVTSRENSLFWTQESLLRQLAKDDPAAAAKWLDQQIANGKVVSSTLELHNDVRISLESAILGPLFSSDIPAAKARLKKFSPEKIEHLLSSSEIINGKSVPEFAELARELLPPDRASSAITKMWGLTHFEDLSKASESLHTAELTDSEKSQVVEKWARNYTRSSDSETKFNDIYEWSKTESPGNEATIVANALAKGRFSQRKIQENFEKALDLSSTLNDPEITNNFISKMTEFSTIENLVDKFEDPQLAEQFRNLHDALPKPPTESE